MLRGRKRQRTWLQIVISNYYRDKSLVDDLTGTGYCKYESRLVLRSTEIQPLFYDLFINPPSILSLLGLYFHSIISLTIITQFNFEINVTPL